MRKTMIALAGAAALSLAPVASGYDLAEAGGSNIVKGIIGGLIAGAVISGIVRAGQYHCHGPVCHSHGYAGPYHYHDAYGNILYQAPTYVAPPPPPPPVVGSYPQAHSSWCTNKYRSYDAGSNSYQPYGNVPRRPCVSPYM